MPSRSLVFMIAVATCYWAIAAAGQTPTLQTSFGGVRTNSLAGPPNLTSFTGVGSCSIGSGNAWAYVVVAVDSANGTTQGSSQIGTTSNGCSSLSTSNYNMFSTSSVPGSVMCVAYRITAPSGVLTGKLANGNFLCGSNFYDQNSGLGSADGSFPPTINTTGSITSSGAVSATSFTAGGMGAGTSVWMTGGQLSLCSSVPPPCIGPMNAFFLQAPNVSISPSFGWTAPSSYNVAAGPLIVGPAAPGTGTPYTSALSVGYLTDVTVSSGSSQPTLATVTGALAPNQLVTITNPSGSNYDLVDGFSGTTGNTSGNLACYTASMTVGSCPLLANNIIGVFNGPGTWISSGEVSVNLDTPQNVAFGDNLCVSPIAASEVHDNGSVPCTTGLGIGTVKTTALGASTATVFLALR